MKIDFNSDEAIYIQLRNQIIMGIATDRIREGDTLPSVRQMAEYVGINMHTVVSLDVDKIQAMEELRQNLDVVLACGICKNISRSEVHQLVDMIYDTYTRGNPECSGDEE